MLNKSEIDCQAVFADWPEPPRPLSHGWNYLVYLSMVLIVVLTLFGNVLVVFLVMKFRHLQTRTNVFIVSLAFADIGVAVLVVPLRAYNVWTDFRWDLGDRVCDVTNTFDTIFCTVSIFNLSCLAFERYLAVCRPFFHDRIRRWMIMVAILVCWLLPIAVFAGPIMSHWHIVGLEDFVACSSSCFLIMNLPFAMFATPVSFYIPTLFMILCYCRIFVCVKGHVRFVNEFAHPKNKQKPRFQQEAKAAKTMGIVMGCYFGCWIFLFVIAFVDPIIDFKVPAIFNILSDWLSYLNSMINPTLYYVFSRPFRKAYRQVFRCNEPRNKLPVTLETMV